MRTTKAEFDDYLEQEFGNDPEYREMKARQRLNEESWMHQEFIKTKRMSPEVIKSVKDAKNWLVDQRIIDVGLLTKKMADEIGCYFDEAAPYIRTSNAILVFARDIEGNGAGAMMAALIAPKNKIDSLPNIDLAPVNYE